MNEVDKVFRPTTVNLFETLSSYISAKNVYRRQRIMVKCTNSHFPHSVNFISHLRWEPSAVQDTDQLIITIQHFKRFRYLAFYE